LFENAEANTENKWPKFYGYAREAGRYVKLSGWEHGNSITGEAEIWTPGRGVELEAPERPEDDRAPQFRDEPKVS
jgi:hypothetical protein